MDPAFAAAIQPVTRLLDPPWVPVDPTFHKSYPLNSHYEDPPLYLALRLRLRDRPLLVHLDRRPATDAGSLPEATGSTTRWQRHRTRSHPGRATLKRPVHASRISAEGDVVSHGCNFDPAGVHPVNERLNDAKADRESEVTATSLDPRQHRPATEARRGVGRLQTTDSCRGSGGSTRARPRRSVYATGIAAGCLRWRGDAAPGGEP
jgi:hypothetical protein